MDNSSYAPDALRDLSEEQTERLTAVLDNYLAQLEAGEQPNLQELLAKNPDIEKQLTLYLGKLGDLHNFAAGFSPQLSGLNGDEQDSSDTFEPVAPPKPLVASDTDQGSDGSTHSPGQQLASEKSLVNDSAQRVPTRVLTGDIDPEESPAGRRLGDFELLRVIGRGGMGIVYEALQLSLRRRVALKLLPLISVLDARQIARFKNEAQAAANLQHPNIVPVHAVGNYQGVHYYAMRFIDGHPLDAIISGLKHKKQLANRHVEAQATNSIVTTESEPGSFDPSVVEDWTVPPAYQRVVRIGIQAASGLAAAHEDGIIHRDIKPSNLMLDKKGKLWITDFGLARRMTDHSLTATGDIMGTLRYMSPEQSKGQSALVDGRSDVYSLGATLYELLALEPAITGETSPAMLRAIEHQMPIPLRQHRPDLPRDLVTVIEKAMSKHREDRYLTAQDFADDLTRVLEGRPTFAKPLTWLERGTKWIQRNQRLVKVSAAILGTCLFFFSAGLAAVISARSREQVYQRQSVERLIALRGQSQAFLAIISELQGVPGAESVRKQGYERLVKDFRTYVTEIRNEEVATAELAMALSDLGGLQLEMEDWSGARMTLSEAEQVLRGLVIKDRKRTEYRAQLASCLARLASVELSTGEATVAEKRLDQALELLDGLIAADPSNAQLRYDHAKAANVMAMLLQRKGEIPSARDWWVRTKSELDRAVDRWPQNTALKEMLFAVCNNLAGAVANTDKQQATELYKTAVDIQTQVCKIDDRVRPSADLASAYSNLGRSLAREGKHAEARDAYTRARELNNLVRQLHPNNRDYARALSINLNNLGTTQQHLADTAGAEQSFSQAIEIQEELCRLYPDNASLHHELGGTYNNLANLLEKAGDIGQVDRNYKKAIEHQRMALEAVASDPANREFLHTHLLNYGQWLAKTNRFDLALEAFQESQSLWTAGDSHQMVVARELADAALGLAEKHKSAEALRFGQAAKRVLELAQDAGLSVQSYLKQDSFSSLAKLKSLTELARP